MSCWVCGFVAPGGVIASTDRWLVDHCVGPLGVGTLIVRSHRHVERVGDLTAEEAQELGPLLQAAMFEAREPVPEPAMAAFAERARAAW